jgi:hypothetical protein
VEIVTEIHGQEMSGSIFSLLFKFLYTLLTHDFAMPCFRTLTNCAVNSRIKEAYGLFSYSVCIVSGCKIINKLSRKNFEECIHGLAETYT